MTLLEELYENKDINEIYKNCKWTNTISHWKIIKESYTEKYWPNTVILYQVGTFFETYFHDAYLTSKLIGQTLTSKNKKEKYAPPMAGSPKYSFKEKIKKLLTLWYNVILVEEIWIKQKNWFDREVTQILTPWTNLDNIWNYSNDYVYNIFLNFDEIWISILDVSSNEFYTFQIEKNWEEYKKIKNLFSIYNPQEITINEKLKEDKNLYKFLKDQNKNIIEINYKEELVLEYFSKSKLDTLKNLNYNTAIYSLNSILKYVIDIHQTSLSYIKDVEIINPENYFFLDSNTINNLEIFKNTNGRRKNSLFNIINNTTTSFWNRMLKNQLITPLKNIDLINERLELIESLLSNTKIRDDFIKVLLNLDDIERLSSKLISNLCNPNHILSLKNSLIEIQELKNIIKTLNNDQYNKISEKLLTFDELIKEVDNYLKETGWTSSKNWDIIKYWINKELDWYIKLSDKNMIQEWYKQLEEKLKLETWIPYIKVDENNLWPFIEVKKRTKVPKEWKKIKMLKDYDRYEISELINYYRDKLDITTKRNLLEYKIFEKLRIKLSFNINDIQQTAKNVWLIDIAVSHSLLTEKNNYCKPFIDNSREIFIEEWRHPVIEQITKFSSNNTIFNPSKNLHLITWPNMGWKSTYIRQIALILLLSHIWCYVPAKRSIIGLIDWIYTRVWASDNLSEWESTFFVEMNETSNILNQANKNSFIVLDEIWRWTSNDDWYALSQSITEYIIEKGIRTVFATHYHELNKLERIYDKIENFHVDAEINDNNNLKFNHKIKKGWTNKSYWIEIWKLAGLPESVIIRANQLKKINK